MDPIQADLYQDMNELGKLLKQLFNPYGFALLVFDYGNNGRMNYISSAERESMIAAMKEFIAKHEGRVFEAPTKQQ